MTKKKYLKTYDNKGELLESVPYSPPIEEVVKKTG